MMQQMEIRDYINERPRCRGKCRGDSNQSVCGDFTKRRVGQLLFLGFGVLCIIQATLNISLRLTLYSGTESTQPKCNTTGISGNVQIKEVQKDCKENNPCHCNDLQERFNSLTRERDELKGRVSQLQNNIALQKKCPEVNLGERTTSSQGCPEMWREINSRCYFLSRHEKKTWEDSRKYCRSKGAALVVINSEQEQKDIYRLDNDQYLLFWIGLHVRNKEYEWVDGSTPTTLYWQDGQPDRGGPNNVEDCVEMYHKNPVLTSWNDAPCGALRHWLCEKDL
ncbi:C-type lectin domain family 10 member A-like [Pholidichthys leucotaenia]